MLRKKAIIRAALVSHVTKMMKLNTLTIESCYRAPPEVLHLSLERMRFESDDVLIQILNTIWLSRPSAITTLSYLGNSVLARIEKQRSCQIG